MNKIILNIIVLITIALSSSCTTYRNSRPTDAQLFNWFEHFRDTNNTECVSLLKEINNDWCWKERCGERTRLTLHQISPGISKYMHNIPTYCTKIGTKWPTDHALQYIATAYMEECWLRTVHPKVRSFLITEIHCYDRSRWKEDRKIRANDYKKKN